MCSRLSRGEACAGEIRESLEDLDDESYGRSTVSNFITELKEKDIIRQTRRDSRNRIYYEINWDRLSDIFLEGLLKIYSPRNTWDEIIPIDLQDDENFRKFYKSTEEYKQSVDEGQDEMSCFWIAELALAGEDRHRLKPHIEKTCRNYLQTNAHETLNEMFQDIEKSADSILVSTDSFGEKNPENIIATIVGHTKSPLHAPAFGAEERIGLTPFMSSILASTDEDNILEKLEKNDDIDGLLDKIVQKLQLNKETT